MIDRLFRKVSYVQIMVNTAASIAMTIDNVVVGKFMGVKAVGAYGAVAPLLLTIMALSQILSTGGQMKCSEALGKGEKEEANGIASLTVLLALVFSVLSIVLCFTMQQGILSILGVQSGSELYDHTLQYMLGFMIGAPGFIGMLVLVPFIQLDGDKKCVIRSLIIMTIVDGIGDVLAAAVFHAGMFGIGIASSVSYYCVLIVLLFHFVKSKDGLKLGIKGIRFRTSGEIVRLGAPAALQKVLRTLLSLTMNRILIALGGAVVLGIFTVINTILNLFNSVGQGMGAGTLLLTGIFYAEEDKHSLKKVMQVFVKYSFIYNLIMMGIVFLAADPLIRMFTKADVDAGQAAVALRLAITDFTLYALANCFNKYYQGIKNQTLTYVITVTEAFLFSAAASFPLMLLFGVNGICCAFAVGDFLSLVMLYIVVCIKNKSLVRRLDQFLLLGEAFGAPEDCIYRREISSVEEAAAAAADVSTFVGKHGSEADIKRLQNILSLCVEEICKNIVTHGFSERGKNHLEVSMTAKEQHFTLQIRDDCKKYNPVEFYRQYTETHSDLADEKYGLKIVFGITEDINYLGTLGLNTLVIRA